MNRRHAGILIGCLFHSALSLAAPAAAAGATTSGGIDPRLVGTWVHEKMINSGGASFASFTTVRTVKLEASGRATQWVQSVGGGADWHYGAAAPKADVAGRWLARDGVIYLQPDGASEFQPVSRYRFSDPYLVTESQQGRMIWQRR